VAIVEMNIFVSGKHLSVVPQFPDPEPLKNGLCVLPYSVTVKSHGTLSK